MSEWRPRPLRSLRHEAISLLEVAVIPVAIAFVFPYEAVGFHADKRNQESGPSCAFVVLSEAEERVALAAARTQRACRDSGPTFPRASFRRRRFAL